MHGPNHDIPSVRLGHLMSKGLSPGQAIVWYLTEDDIGPGIGTSQAAQALDRDPGQIRQQRRNARAKLEEA